MAILDFQKILQALFAENVRFILVGGMAGIGHGMDYVTSDVDLCYQRSKENYQAIVKALKPAHPQLRVENSSIPFLFDEKTIANGLNFTLDSDWGYVDLMGEILGVGTYEQLLPNAQAFDFYGFQVNTISLDDLIRAKKTANRTKDKLHLLELEALKDIFRK